MGELPLAQSVQYDTPLTFNYSGIGISDEERAFIAGIEESTFSLGDSNLLGQDAVLNNLKTSLSKFEFR